MPALKSGRAAVQLFEFLLHSHAQMLWFHVGSAVVQLEASFGHEQEQVLASNVWVPEQETTLHSQTQVAEFQVGRALVQLVESFVHEHEQLFSFRV